MAMSAPQSPKTSASSLTGPATYLSPSHLRVYYDDLGRCRSLSPRGMASTTAPTQIRRKLTEFNTIDDAARLLKAAKNVIVLSGAGISTSVGIPDFRGNEGIYNTTKSEIFTDTEDIFALENFKQYPSEFYKVVRKIIPRLNYYQAKDGHIEASSKVAAVPKFGSVHAFLKLLQDSNKLLTTYTQNIDGLEKVAGVDGAKVINCHGTWDGATCLTCAGRADPDTYLQAVVRGLLPLCDCSSPSLHSTMSRRGNEQRKARAKNAVNVQDFTYLKTDRIDGPVRSPVGKAKSSSRKRKWASSDDEDDGIESETPPSIPGLLKPSIVFFDEDIFDYGDKLKEDKKSVDLLLIIGTSLSVKPVSELPFKIPANVPQIWISNKTLKHKALSVDIELIGKCDLVVEELCERAGWSTKLKNRVWFNNLGSRMQAKSIVRAKSDERRPRPTKTVRAEPKSPGRDVAAEARSERAVDHTKASNRNIGNTAKSRSWESPSHSPMPHARKDKGEGVPSIKIEDPPPALDLPIRSPTLLEDPPGAEVLAPLTPQTTRSSNFSTQETRDESWLSDLASTAGSTISREASPTKAAPNKLSLSKSTEMKGLPGLRIEQDELQDWKWYIRKRLSPTKLSSP